MFNFFKILMEALLSIAERPIISLRPNLSNPYAKTALEDSVANDQNSLWRKVAVKFRSIIDK